ncbi:MAG: SDR family oxidoreductase [Spirochaetes bacterium]|nr:SDR family oxidoreductase [Spirochaetota bacterium]
MKILVTGATGKLGRKVVESLLKSVPPDQLAVSVRNPAKAEDLKNLGIDVRHGDFDQPETLDKAFAGIDRLLIISTDGDNDTRIRQHLNAVSAAQQANVGFIAYTSVVNAQQNKLSLGIVHKTTENAIIKTGIPYTFLRNNWYLENEIQGIKGALAGNPWVTSAETGKVGWALQQDYAEAASAVMAGKNHENKIYELSGKLLTQEELVSDLEAVTGKTIPVLKVDDVKYAEIIKWAGAPDFLVLFLLDIQKNIREGELAIESNDFEKLLGRPATPVHDALSKIISAISSNS